MGVKFGGLDVEQLMALNEYFALADVDHGPRRGLTRGCAGPRLLVLACEDEERIVELLRALTEPLGVDLVAARDGATALAHLAARRPALMTLDLVLPNLDGFARARAHPPAARARRHADRRHLGASPTRARSSAPTGSASSTSWPSRSTSTCSTPSSRSSCSMQQAGRRGARRARRSSRTSSTTCRRGSSSSTPRGVIVKVNAAACTVAVAQRPSRWSGAPSPTRCPAPSRCSSSPATRRSGASRVQTAHGERNLGFTNAAVEVNGAHGRAGGLPRAVGGRGGAARAGGARAARGAGARRRAASPTRCAIRWRPSAPRRR